MLSLYPLRSNRHLMRELQRNFDELFLAQRTNYFAPHTLRPNSQQTETDDAYILRLEAPGLTQSDLKITVEKDRLNIEGQRENIAPEGYDVLRQERSNIDFSHQETLPPGINNLEISAVLKDGILSIRLPKEEAVKPRTIKIQANDTQES